ncbi:UbiA prenyltransferase family protein [Candidatus Woesebacteria bacterium]|nr:UbiA prenyltransferase family protein [Candidatus Woesebacteria bacterium]
MANLPIELIKAARPAHWIKNFALFAALIFSGNLLSKPHVIIVLIAFVSFSLTTSATYIFNDILDAKRDRLHPIKKYRPIASGKLNISTAYFTAFVLASTSLYIASQLNFLFFTATLSYLAIQALYSLGLKNLSIIDILIIASGFIIRVYAGAFVINAHLSVWFLLCVISVALFLASGKRRAELGVVSKVMIGSTRKSLTRYSKRLIDSYVTMFGNAAWMSWALFTFFESPPVDLSVWLFLAEISRTTTISKLMMATIPIVIFGIMRYESIIFQDKSEAPEKLLLTDIPLVLSIGIWLISIIAILYYASAMP